MVLAYPIVLSQGANGTFVGSFPDVPEAFICGADEHHALQWAADALVVALSGYVEAHRAIPLPTPPREGQATVHVPPLVAAKLAIYQAMQEQRVSQEELAKRLRCDARQVRRLLDLEHQSRLDQLEAGLGALGKRLVIEVREAA